MPKNVHDLIMVARIFLLWRWIQAIRLGQINLMMLLNTQVIYLLFWFQVLIKQTSAYYMASYLLNLQDQNDLVKCFLYLDLLALILLIISHRSHLKIVLILHEKNHWHFLVRWIFFLCVVPLTTDNVTFLKFKCFYVNNRRGQIF